MTYTIKKPSVLDITNIYKGKILKQEVVVALPKNGGTIQSVADKFGILSYRYYKSGPNWTHLALPFLDHMPQDPQDILIYTLNVLHQPHLKMKEIHQHGVVLDAKKYKELLNYLSKITEKDINNAYDEYKKKWDEESMKYCFIKGDLIHAGTLDKKKSRFLTRQKREKYYHIYETAYKQLQEER
jgi:hypothetical protein